MRPAASTAFCIAVLACGHRWVRVSAMRGLDGAARSTRRSRSSTAAAAKATSATPAPNRPAVSRCHDTGLTPTIGISRYDGLNPATPQYAAGRITEPAVCVPKVIGTKPAATAAAEPADEPPGVCARLCGLRVADGTSDANCVVTVLPIMTPPARRVSATAVASAGGR